MIFRSIAARRTAMGLLFACCATVGANAVCDDRATAVLESVSGSPTIFELSAGETRHASYVSVGRRYELPIEIETGSADAATFSLPNSVIEVSANSVMRIVAPEDHDTGVIQRVLQEAGSSLFRVHRGTIDRFQVETPFLVSVVKGTVFNVLVRPDGATVSLQEGRLQVDSLDQLQTVDLLPGDVAFSGRDGALKMLKVEVTANGAKARESAAKRSDTKVAVVGVAGAQVRDVKTAASASVDTTNTTVARVDPAVAAVAAPVADVVDPVVNDAVDKAVAPVVESVVDRAVTPVVDTVVAPLDSVVEPVIDLATPVVDTVIAPVVDTVVTPLVDSVVAPMVTSVVEPVTRVGSAAGGVVSGLLGQ